MARVILSLNVFVLCIINSYSQAPTLESFTLCYEHISIPDFQVALKWNWKYADPPYYLELRVYTRVLASIHPLVETETLYYHLKLTRKVCTSTIKFTRYRPEITSMDITIGFMTNYDGIKLTETSFSMKEDFSYGTYKLRDYVSMLEIYVDLEDYHADKVVRSVAQKYDVFPKSFIIQYVNERVPRREYVCALSNYKLVVLKLVSNYNGPDIGYFSSISVVIFRNQQYVHSETWNAWPCVSWNIVPQMSPTIVIEGSTENVEVLFRKNKLGESENIGRNIDYTTFVSTPTFSCPWLQIRTLSTISSPLTELGVIYSVDSQWTTFLCRSGTNSGIRTYVRETTSPSTQVQKYFPKWTKVGNINVREYEPFKAIC